MRKRGSIFVVLGAVGGSVLVRAVVASNVAHAVVAGVGGVWVVRRRVAILAVSVILLVRVRHGGQLMGGWLADVDSCATGYLAGHG